MFESMFSLNSDQEGSSPSPPEGDSDENPIRLQGDSTGEFKSLLWALYAMCVIANISEPLVLTERISGLMKLLIA
jgi:hypothetical protein